MLKNFLSLFLKSNCLLCQRSGSDLICSYCQGRLDSCKLKNPSKYWQGELPLFAWGVYGGNLKRAIATMKYESHPELGELMGNWLAKAWLTSEVGKRVKKLTVVPIPIHSSKMQERGFNQAELIARSFCQLTGYSLQKQGLIRMRDTKPMFDLNPKEREENIKGALSLGKDFQHRHPAAPVLLVDDIYTRGTTVREASQVLSKQKISVFGAIVVSMTSRD
jgi:ComF family protein